MAWSVLQSFGADIATAVATATPVQAYTSGSKLIAFTVCSNAGTDMTSVKDANGNAFTKLTTVTNAGNMVADIWVMDLPGADAGNSPTIVTAGGGTNGQSITVLEVSGLAAGTTTAACYDGTAGTATGSIVSSGNSTTPTYVSSILNGFLVDCYGDNGDNTGSTFTGPAGYTAAAGNRNGNSTSTTGVFYKNATAGTETGTISDVTVGGATAQYGRIFVAFKLGAVTAASATPPPVPPGRQSPAAWSRLQVPQASQQAPGVPSAPATQTPHLTPPGLQSPMAWGRLVVPNVPQVTPFPGAAALSGLGSLTAAAQVDNPLAAALSGTGSLTASGVVATQSVTPQRVPPGRQSPMAWGRLVVPNVPQPTVYPAAAALSGTGSLTAAAQVNNPLAAALSGTGALTAAVAVLSFQPALALLIPPGRTSPMAWGRLVVPQVSTTGIPSITGAAALSGTGSLTAAAAVNFEIAAALSGTGALTAAAQVDNPLAAALSGTGSLTAAAVVNNPLAAALSGTGSLTAAAAVLVVSSQPALALLIPPGRRSPMAWGRLQVWTASQPPPVVAPLFTVGALTAATAPGATLTASGTSGTLAAATGSGTLTAVTSAAGADEYAGTYGADYGPQEGTLTATDKRTGGPS